MTSNLANYIFSKETLYRNRVSETPEFTEIKLSIEQKVGVEEPVPVLIPPKDATKFVASMFKFQNKVLILTNTISESEKTLLVKIIGAVGLTIEQIDLIELGKIQTLDYQSLLSQNITKKFISFGVGLGKINWNILLNIYQPKNINGIDILLSDELRVLESNLDLKKKLWEALKTMFSY
jgi:DNA polymerase III psi subunit